MEILGIDLGNSLVRVCVISCGCCSVPTIIFMLLSRLTGGRLSILPMVLTLLPLAFGQVINFFADRFDNRGTDADEIAERRVNRTRGNLRERLNAANQSFNAQVDAPPPSSGNAQYPANDPLDPRQFQSQNAPPPTNPRAGGPRRPGRQRGQIPRTGGPQRQGGGDPRFRGGVDPLAGPSGDKQSPPRQGGGDPRFHGGADPLAGPPPSGNNPPPRPPMRNRYDRRSDDPFETAGGVRSPQGDDLFGPASLPGLHGRDFGDEPRRNPRRDTRNREHNDDEIFGGYFDEDGDGYSDH